VGQRVFADLEAEDVVSLKRLLGAKLFRESVHEATPFDLLALTLSNQRTVAGAVKTTEAKDHEGKSVCVCIFLTGTPGKKVRCTIYKDRPKVCHEAVAPGDKACMVLRTVRGVGASR